MAIEYRWAEGRNDRLPALAADLVRRQVAVIVATGAGESLRGQGSDHQRSRSSSHRRRPGQARACYQPEPAGRQRDRRQYFRNLTLAAKRLELLRELVPTAATIAFLVNPSNPTATASD